MTDINLKTLTPDTSLPTTGFLFGADSQASTNPSVYSTQTVATTLLGSTSLTGDTLTASAPVLDLAQTWNSSGTTFTGVKFNAAGSSSTNSAAASLLMDLQVGGTSKFTVDKGGIASVKNVTPGGTTGGGFQILNTTGTGIQFALSVSLSNNKQAAFFPVGDGNSAMGLRFVSVGTAPAVVDSMSPDTINNSPVQLNGVYLAARQAAGTGLNTPSGAILLQVAGGGLSLTSATNFNWNSDTFLIRSSKGAANLQLGAADAATPVAQTLSVQSVVAGTSNTVGQNFTINGSQSTGSGIGGSIIFQTAAANSGGGATVQNTLATAMVIDSVKTVRLGTGYTVATLPAAGTAGRRTYVTDALAPTFLGTLTGGGSVVSPVFDNGTAWVSA